MRKYYFDLILGIVFGLVVALYCLMGPAFATRLVIPYAFAVVLLISLLTSIKTMLYKCMSKGPYVKTIIIAALVFFVFTAFIVGTAVIPMGALKIFLTFAIATSFGIVLTTGIRFVYSLR